tara:strand:+ start:162 stop:500 length:339 start_codon:yes stop_codon:yes gene_type:complete
MNHIISIFSTIFLLAQIGCGSIEHKTQISVNTIQCGMCQKTIEKGLGSVKGVKSVHVTLKDKVAHVTHDPTIVDLAAMELTISKLGYQANEVLADPVAYEALPKCCKIGGGH